MRLFLCTAVSLVVLSLTDTAARSEENKLPAAAENILRKAAQIELLSIDPGDGKAPPAADGFHGYKILGKTTLKADAGNALVAAFLKGMEGKIDPAKCFEPPHGIRATHDGKTVALVICFACSQFDVYAPAGRTRLLIGTAPAPVFDKVLDAASIPRAK